MFGIICRLFFRKFNEIQIEAFYIKWKNLREKIIFKQNIYCSVKKEISKIWEKWMKNMHTFIKYFSLYSAKCSTLKVFSLFYPPSVYTSFLELNCKCFMLIYSVQESITKYGIHTVLIMRIQFIQNEPQLWSKCFMRWTCVFWTIQRLNSFNRMHERCQNEICCKKYDFCNFGMYFLNLIFVNCTYSQQNKKENISSFLLLKCRRETLKVSLSMHLFLF